MPTMYLIGTPQHKAGKHRIHAPILNSETGKPLKRGELPEGTQTVQTVEFVNGKADVTDAGLVRWLKENAHAAEVEVEAYGLGQPGKPAVIEYDEHGNEIEIEPAQPAPLPTDGDAKAKK